MEILWKIVLIVGVLFSELVSGNEIAKQEVEKGYCSEQEDAENPRVCIDDGCLRGTFMKGYQAGPFEAFIGIPFAKPPVGQLRFAVSICELDGWRRRMVLSHNTACLGLKYVFPCRREICASPMD